MGDQISAWKCEECGTWRRSKEPVTEMHVLEPGPEVITSGNMVERIYIARKLRVCSDCRLEILGEPDDTGFKK